MMRPPYGALSDEAKKWIRKLGYTVVLWNVDTNDWRKENKREGAAAEYVKRQVNGATKPMIVLQHDIHQWSALSAPAMIRNIREAGYHLVDLEQCLGKPAYHAKDWVPPSLYNVEYKDACMPEPDVFGACLSQKDCDHFEAGDKWTGKCPGSKDIKCCTGGCYTMCYNRFGDHEHTDNCKNACIAAKAGHMDCGPGSKEDEESCPCVSDDYGGYPEYACRAGYAFGVTSAPRTAGYECQRLCSSTMHWLDGDLIEYCVSLCAKTASGGPMMKCETCQLENDHADSATACEAGCQLGNSLKARKKEDA
jgi:hypothetical protein